MATKKKPTKKKPATKTNTEPILTDFVFVGLDGAKYKLEPKQKLFCDYWLINGYNGTQAVIDAGYDVYPIRKDGSKSREPNRRSASAISAENLTKLNIIQYINLQLDRSGLNDINVKAHHSYLINQFVDLAAKNKAIDMYYKLNGSYAAEKVEHGIEAEAADLLERMSKILPK